MVRDLLKHVPNKFLMSLSKFKISLSKLNISGRGISWFESSINKGWFDNLTSLSCPIIY